MPKSKKRKGGILEAIRDHKARKFNRQLVAIERSNRFGIAIAKSSPVPTSPDRLHISNLYFDALAKYKCRSNFQYFIPSKRSHSFWTRVLAARDAAGVSSEVFIQAQFDWFDLKFRTTPPLPCLITENAIKRAQAFGGTTSSPVGPPEVKLDRVELLKYYDDLLRNICTANKLSKAEMYIKLVRTGELSVPSFYLEADPVWRNLPV